MSTINNTIKHIKSSLQHSQIREKTTAKTQYSINDVVVNGMRLPGFGYEKLSLQRQTRKNKIKHSRLKTLETSEKTY